MPDFTQLKRVAFRAETTGRVKELAGFFKGHSIPDRDSASARKFIARIAADDIQADLDQTYQALRESFGFKRRQLEASVDEGCGVIRTPRFIYSISLTVDPSNPNYVLWRREVSSLRDPLLVRGAEFQAVFGTLFNALVFEFARPIAVDHLVDRFEEGERAGVKVSCASDASWCEITLTGFRGAIRIDSKNLTISGRQSPSAASLLDQFLKFIDRLPRRRDWPAIR
jgi:hypothetical protein